MKYITAVLTIAVFTAAVSIVFPRIAPIAVRAGLLALLVVLAFWAYEYIKSKPPRLAARVHDLIRARGPVTVKEIVNNLGASYEEVVKALEYLTEMGLVRKFTKGDEVYYDIS